MKIFNLLVLASLLAFTTSCDKDDDVDCNNLSETIVGEWTVTALGLDLGDVEFKSDGTLIDPDGVLIEGEVGGVVFDEKSYTVDGNESFTAKAENGGNSAEVEYTVTSLECNEINLSVLGIAATMNRR